MKSETAEMWTDVGTITAPSGMLAFAMAGWADLWPQTGAPLSRRGDAAAGVGGVHLRDGLAEAVVVRADPDKPLPVRATTTPSPFDGSATIATLEVGLGLPWRAQSDRDTVLLGDLPVDRCGMLLGDVAALDGFVGLAGESIDGLADVAYWGKHADAAHAELGGQRLGSPGHPRGWLDITLAEARIQKIALEAWMARNGHAHGLMIDVEAHTHFSLLRRAGWGHPLMAGMIDLAGARILGFEWDQGDHSIRHRGERPYGQVYPVALERSAVGETLLRWSIPPYEDRELPHGG